MTSQRFLVLIALILTTGLLCSCEEEHVIIDRFLPPTPPFAGSEDQLIANFQAFHEDLDYNEYIDLLHTDFEMFLQLETQQEFPDVGLTLDRDEELRIYRRMFSGQPLTDPDGNLVPGVSNFRFQTFVQEGDWSVSPLTDQLPNTRFSLFDVGILADRPGFSTIPLTGQVKFYVAGRDSLHNGAARTYWQLIGMQDLTDSSKNDAGSSWGSFKAFFWTPED